MRYLFIFCIILDYPSLLLLNLYYKHKRESSLFAASALELIRLKKHKVHHQLGKGSYSQTYQGVQQGRFGTCHPALLAGRGYILQAGVYDDNDGGDSYDHTQELDDCLEDFVHLAVIAVVTGFPYALQHLAFGCVGVAAARRSGATATAATTATATTAALLLLRRLASLRSCARVGRRHDSRAQKSQDHRNTYNDPLQSHAYSLLMT
jgi:hypothetical protein